MPGNGNGAELAREIQELTRRFAAEDAAKQARDEADHRFRLEQHRDELRSGKWRPRHWCQKCAEAILTCDPELVCEEALKGPDMWWA